MIDMLRVVHRREPIEISIRHYDYPTLKVYKVDGTFVGPITNEVELLRFLHDVLKYGVCAEYYIVHDGTKIFITPLGELTEWPDGMYDESQKIFAAMLPMRKAVLRTQDQPPQNTTTLN